MGWTEEKVNKLKDLWGKGKTASQIAEIIGGISRNAVIGKAHRLNLSAKIKSKSHAYKIIDHLITIGQLEKFGKRNCNRTIVLPKRKNSHNESSNKQNKVLRGIYIYD